ncbi:MAG: NDP-sugar synthase [Candidatus Liptonbacteria bacterium]|nr:NDP-sugar synthase [Candidatus Liptonbacteria bacterium]
MVDLSNYKVFILAAGLGTRLGDLGKNLPKVMFPVGGKPLLENTINLLKFQGFGNFILNTHYFPEKIAGYFSKGEKMGVSIEYSDESKKLLETAGAIKKAENLLTEDFVLIYGDQVFSLDIRPLIELHKDRKALATIVLKRSDEPQNGDLVEIDPKTSKITGWHQRPHNFKNFSENMFLNAGIYVLSKKITEFIPEGKSRLDIDIFPALVKNGAAIYGFPTGEKILDIGTPEKYEYAKKWYEEQKSVISR